MSEHPPTLDPITVPKEHKPMVCGGNSEEKPATEEHQKLADQVRKDVEDRHGSLDEYVVETFRTQVVNGTNYTLKIRVGPGKHIEIRVHQPLPMRNEPPSLMAF